MLGEVTEQDVRDRFDVETAEFFIDYIRKYETCPYCLRECVLVGGDSDSADTGNVGNSDTTDGYHSRNRLPDRDNDAIAGQLQPSTPNYQRVRPMSRTPSGECESG